MTNPVIVICQACDTESILEQAKTVLTRWRITSQADQICCSKPFGVRWDDNQLFIIHPFAWRTLNTDVFRTSAISTPPRGVHDALKVLGRLSVLTR